MSLHAYGRGDARPVTPLRIYGFTDLRTRCKHDVKLATDLGSASRGGWCCNPVKFDCTTVAVRNTGLVAHAICLTVPRLLIHGSTGLRSYAITEMKGVHDVPSRCTDACP